MQSVIVNLAFLLVADSDTDTLALVTSRASVVCGMMTELRITKNALLDGLTNSPPGKPFVKRRCISDVSILSFAGLHFILPLV